MSSARKATQAQKLGLKAEQYFSTLLLKHGFAILARNYYAHKIGEIDIIANRANHCLCVEVKARTIKHKAELDEMIAEKAVTTLKKSRMKRTMMHYLYSQNINIGYEISYFVGVYYVDNRGKVIKTDLISCD